MVGNQFLGGVVLQRATFEPGDDPVSGIVDLVHADGLLVAAGCQNGGLVHQVLQIGTREACSSLGDVHERDLAVELLVLHVDLQDLSPPLHIGQTDLHAAVEAARTEKGVVQDIGPVRGGHDDDAAVALKAVHLREDLIQGLLSLVVATSHASSSLTSDGIDLIDENNARRLLLRLLEDVADARRTHTNEELDELGGGGLDERHAGLASERLGHEGLSCSRGSGKEHAARDLRAHLHEPLRGL
mmetsp:Transcript_68675/g.161541  ORF Transcript_68675/g.161541 Transcript_68675/m.161541 type:complete len:243 (+) Transcript_68675:641-1369(+)